MKNEIKNFLEVSIEEIFKDRFSRYSKYIIQDRALPDVRDGLKPVQRRIIYAMYQDGNVFEKQFRKSAKTVGNVIGNFHPHGDSSVYEAMVRMSQDWKNNELLVLMHGNNGSIDGDSPAAMRYTEAKLSQYANLMVKNIHENSVDMIPNFDDTELEPVVLPSRVPNLLINGATGISSGYATDIPPHNIKEIINACIFVNKNPDASLEEIMEIVPGPDFPTGGIIQGKEGIRQAYLTGKGKIVISCKYELFKKQIKITEIPYDVNKANLLQKIDLIRIEKKVEGIASVVDESDQDGLLITINLKDDVNSQAIINYLLKNTDLQKNYNFNMVAINKRKPEQLGIKQMIEAFLQHREEVILKRSQFRLNKAKNKLHILEGLVLAVNNLDEVIKIIKNSKNKQESKDNLINKFSITKEQAEAIVMLQLYRLSNTDLADLYENQRVLNEQINILNKIIESKDVLKNLITTELEKILENYQKNNRKSIIQEEITNIEINKLDLIKEEECFVAITKEGYIKRVNVKSYYASSGNYDVNMINVDVLKTNTRKKSLICFSDGTAIVIPNYDIPETKWKDNGVHLSTIGKINDNVDVISIFEFSEMNEYNSLMAITKEGYINNFKFNEFNEVKLKQKFIMQKLKQNDVLISCDVVINDFTTILNNNCLIITTLNRYINLDINTIEEVSLKKVGKKVMRLRQNEEILKLITFNEDIIIFTNDGYYKKITPMSVNVCDKPQSLFEELKSKKQEIKFIQKLNNKKIVLINEDEAIEIDTDKLTYSLIEDKLKNLQNINEIINIEKIIE